MGTLEFLLNFSINLKWLEKNNARSVFFKSRTNTSKIEIRYFQLPCH